MNTINTMKEPRMLYRTAMPSPIGMLTIVANDDAVVAIMWDTESDQHEPDAKNPVERAIGEQPVTTAGRGKHAVLDLARTQLTEYFDGSRTEFDLPLEPSGSEFQRQAWQVLRQIPFGETLSYGEQAASIGDKRMARAVGAANGKNPIPIVVPCHRVVGSNGHLTGFAGGLNVKAWLLDHEFRVRATTQPPT
jgi:methylated-DNA-[protein]-cysteine S-methyltransferase